MNDRRRKKVERVAEKVLDATTDLIEICTNEQEAFDNMPESIQFSTRGDEMQEILDVLDQVVGELEDAMTNLYTHIVGED